MSMLSNSAVSKEIFHQVATMHIAIISFVVTLCIFLVGPLFAETPDGTPPSQESVCTGLSGKAFGLCNAYCEAQDCDVNPKSSCETLRDIFEDLTGSPIFPCDKIPSCVELNPTQVQIDEAVAIAIAGIDNAWGNVSDFQLLLDKIEALLGCTLQVPNDAASTQSLQEVLPQQAETCAVEGVHYCGPGTSETGTTLHTESSCLNEACCRHDTCYGVNCIDGDCYWTTQTQGCDTDLRAVCDGGCALDTEGRIICALVRRLDDRANPESHPECANPPSCTEGPEPDCAGQTCYTFTTCNPGSGCNYPVCGSLAEGGGLCVEGTTSCSELGDCTTSSDCSDDELCFVDSCCGRPVCVPASAFCPDIGANPTVQGQAMETIKGESTIRGW